MLTDQKQFGLTEEQIAFYRENGYLHIPAVFTREEAAYLRAEAHALIQRLAARAGANRHCTRSGAARNWSATRRPPCCTATTRSSTARRSRA
jgi:hypothetical protein